MVEGNEKLRAIQLHLWEIARALPLFRHTSRPRSHGTTWPGCMLGKKIHRSNHELLNPEEMAQLVRVLAPYPWVVVGVLHPPHII